MKFHLKYKDEHETIPMDVVSNVFSRGSRGQDAPIWDGDELWDAMDSIVPADVGEREWVLDFAFEKMLSDMYEGGQRRGLYEVHLDEDLDGIPGQPQVKWWVELTPQEEEEWGDLYWSKKPKRFPEERR